MCNIVRTERGKSMKKITKFLSLALATVIAISSFSITGKAASRADENRRDLTAQEIAYIAQVFDADYYATAYPDLKDASVIGEEALFTHFITFGIWEERQCNVNFNVDVYASRNPDLQEAFGSDIVSYYVHKAIHAKEQWRAKATLNDAYYNGVTIYSVYDFVKGQTGPVAGAIPVQHVNYAPALGIGVD